MTFEDFSKYVDQAAEDELRILNRQIVDRLRYLAEQQTRKASRIYSIGDRVEFDDPGGRALQGVVIRINRRTITVKMETGFWRVAPGFLRPALHLEKVEIAAAGRLAPLELDVETVPAVGPDARPPEIGRNAPCPCGSGKKFKKCCRGK